MREFLADHWPWWALPLAVLALGTAVVWALQEDVTVSAFHYALAGRP